jgi:Tol biopolymer transport system component
MKVVYAAGALLIPVMASADHAVRLDPEGVYPGYTVRFTPDGSRAVFMGNAQDVEGTAIYSVPLSNPAGAVRLNTVPRSATPWHFVVSPDSRSVAFQSMENPPEGRLLINTFGVPVDGSSPPALLHSAPVEDDDPSQFPYGFSGDSTRVLFDGETERSAQNLYSRPVDGSLPALRLSHTVTDARAAASFRPAGGRVLYLAPDGLFTIPNDGSADPVPVAAGVNIDVLSVGVTPDNSRVVFDTFDPYKTVEVFSAPADGSAPPVLLYRSEGRPWETNLALNDPQITPDGSRVLMVADYGTALVIAPVDGSAPARVLDRPAGIGRPVISPDGAVAVYNASRGAGLATELYSVATNGSEAPVKLAGPFPQDLTLRFSEVPSSAGRVAYWLDDGWGANELYTVPLDGSGAPTRIDLPAEYDDGTSGAVISPDGRFVIFHAGDNTDQDPILERGALFMAPVEGGTPVRLSDPVPGDSYIRGYWFVPHTSSLVYLVEGTQDGAMFSDLMLVTVPEPHAAGWLAVALVLPLRRRRR